MAHLKVIIASMSNCISTRFIMVPAGNVLIYRDFVSATRPSQKIDKETCQKIIEAAEAVKEGAKEVKSVGEYVKKTVSDSAGNVISEVAKAALEKATEKEEKGAWDKVKDSANDIKNKVVWQVT